VEALLRIDARRKLDYGLAIKEADVWLLDLD
jgi:hypothetical protein